MEPAPTAAPHDGRFPVSVKAVLIDARRVVLLRNERSEWELPGGRLEPGETPEACVRREIREELAIDAAIGPILDCWVYEVLPGRRVVIVTYGATAATLDGIAHSAEHGALALVPLDALSGLAIPEGYRASIARWRRLVDAGRAP
ncbi:MAG: NUDIX domain-containing protein [Alphaproteobacteria bacterium]|nr:NUDIX domain-containing protein [Alphaproteobacteria bacterium]